MYSSAKPAWSGRKGTRSIQHLLKACWVRQLLLGGQNVCPLELEKARRPRNISALSAKLKRIHHRYFTPFSSNFKNETQNVSSFFGIKSIVPGITQLQCTKPYGIHILPCIYFLFSPSKGVFSHKSKIISIIRMRCYPSVSDHCPIPHHPQCRSKCLATENESAL